MMVASPLLGFDGRSLPDELWFEYVWLNDGEGCAGGGYAGAWAGGCGEMGESASFIARLARISDNSSRSLWAASRRIAFLQAIHTIVSKTARTLPGLGEGTDGEIGRAHV